MPKARKILSLSAQIIRVLYLQKIITPILLKRIRSLSPGARIRILVATGFHRESTHEELVDKYGEDIVKNEEIVMHVSTDDSYMV